MAAEIKTGVISAIFDENTGSITEDGTGSVRDFYHPEAQVIFSKGQGVDYVLITFPNGKPPIVIDVKGK